MNAGMGFRLVRAAAFAVACLGLGVVAHFFGGGGVSGPGMAAGLGLSFAAALPLTGRERTTRVILPLLASLQVALHLVFSLAHSAAPATAAGGHLHAGLGMVVVHGWAAVLTALWLARGEAALWSLLRRLAIRLRLVLAVPFVPAWPSFTIPAASGPRVPRTAVLRHEVTRRGPPAVARAA